MDHDILSPARLADPYPYFAEMRENCPVHWNEQYRAWFVYRYDDVVAAFRDSAFSSDRVRPVFNERLSAEKREARKATYDVLQHWMVFLDQPDHTRIRKLVMPAFTPKTVASMRPRVEKVVAEAVDAITGRDSLDLVHDLAYPIPAVVIAELMGVPAEDRELFKEWSDEIVVLIFGAKSTADRHERAQLALTELSDYLRSHIARLREQPGDNLISRILESREQEPPLTDDEVVSTCALLIFGGHETTTNMIANGMRAFLQNPDQWELLKNDPELAKSAVEEVLRFDGAAKMSMRRLVQDVELRGNHMKAGDTVYLVQASANRDPAVFENPDSFDITRTPNRHLAFGFGLHHCLGNFLARLEGQLAFEALAVRCPDLAIADSAPEWHPTLISRGMTSFPVTNG
ncbi:cytochrome P450 [Rhodococcus sp. OK302]|uniref:cytochrome P450 n=1 Tax=Rhodococcus sp. OK302 TaxID=1882769 RepID=UPI000B943498|nr:cytochrome P450 [Rhodococcus sp. OK302]OYD71121.1 cytochrome P450 [Rhodococcus sp. OK302]